MRWLKRGEMDLHIQTDAEEGRPVLIHAHPGHELRLFHWMERYKPLVLLMTDGAGGAARARTQLSAECVEQAGARAGDAFGVMSDRAWYEAILRGDTEPFEAAIDTIVESAGPGRLIVTDAVDGYNPMHDLCEAVGAAAAARLRRQGRSVTHLVARAIAGGEGAIAAELLLDSAALQRKRMAVERYLPLADEARRLLDEEPGALAVERLRHPSFIWPDNWSPEWEAIGKSRVALSRYARPIEYAKHVRPIARALLDGATRLSRDNKERARCAS